MSSQKILLAYASKGGSARQAADWIAEELGDKVDLLDLRKTSKVELAQYDTVILGTGIRIGKAYKPLQKFIKRRREELKHKDICLYITHLEEGEGVEQDFASAFDEEFLNSVRVKVGVGGRVRLANFNFLIRMALRRIGMEAGKDFTDYDRLSREACKSFAEQVLAGRPD